MKRGAITVFISSAAVMLVELIAGRLVAPYFGQSTRTWAALTAVTLAGCTIGNAIGGCLSGRNERRRLLVAFACAAVYAAALPHLLPFFKGFGLVGFVSAGWLPLTIALGSVSPLVASLFVRAESNGHDLGFLYFFSMVGSMIGSLVGGLYLPFVLPADTLYLIFAVMLAVAPVLLAGREGRETGDARGDASDADGECETHGAVLPLAATDFKMLLLAVFAIGAIGMAVEMTAARLVTAVLGGNHVVWSLIFVSFIGWMGLGGFVGGRLADRFAKRWLVTVALGLTSLSIALTSIIQTRMFGEAVLLWPTSLRLFVQIILGFAPVACMLGAASTVLLKFGTAAALARGDRRLIGFLYATSSAGCVLGTFLTGLVLIGFIPSITLMLAFAMATALLALPDRNAWYCVFAAPILAHFARIPLPNEMETSHDQRLLCHRESLYNVVTVTCDVDKETNRTIWLDRIPHTSSDIHNLGLLSSSYTRMIAAAVAAHSNDTANVFMIGGGGYALPSYWVDTNYRGEVIVAEIDEAVKDAAFAYLAPKLAREEARPGTNFKFPVGDGRAVAETLPEGHFDFVIGDTIADTAIPYHLVTKEFNDKLKRLLRPGGVSITHTLDTIDRPELLSTLVKTLYQTYAHVGVIAYTGVTDVRQSLIVVASDDPSALKLEGTAEILRAKYRNTFLRVIPEADVRKLSERPGAIILSDRFSPVERYVWHVITHDMQRAGTILGERAKKASRDGDWAKARELGLKTLEIEPEQVNAIEALAEYAREKPDDKEVREVLKQQATRPSGLDFAKKAWEWVQKSN